MLKLTITAEDVKDALPPDRVLAEVAAQGMRRCIVNHLRAKNAATPPKAGFPKSHYYAEVSDSARGFVADGKTATVEVGPDDANGPGNGIVLHYEGGTVYPKNGKALAIPINPAVAGIWPSEESAITNNIGMIWPKGSSHGFLKNTETNELLWLLVPKATIPADPSVMPTDDELTAAAEAAVLPLLEAS